MEQFNSVVNKNLGWIHENKYVLPVLSLFLGVYAALARPKLPKFVAKLFENPVFRLVMIAYIIYRGNKDPQLSLMIAAAFLITMHMINKQQVESISVNYDDPNPSGLLKPRYDDPDASSIARSGYDDPDASGLLKPRYDDPNPSGLLKPRYDDPTASSIGRTGYDDPTASSIGRTGYDDPNPSGL